MRDKIHRRLDAALCGVGGHTPAGEVTGSTNKCATDLYPSYNPKALDQCVDVCIKCNHGVMTTCSTSWPERSALR